MIISFNQPFFIPWGGFFGRLLFSDTMILLDATQLSRGFSYVNRNRIKGPAGEVWITVPLKKKGRGDQLIKDLEIFEKEKWAFDFLETLRHFYSKSLYFDGIYAEIKAVIEKKDDSFLQMALELLEMCRKTLDIKTILVLQSNLGVKGKGTKLLVNLAQSMDSDEVIMPYFSKKAIDLELFSQAKIKVWFARYSSPQYPQFWGPYLRKLSILDLLFCCGPDGRAVIEKGTRLFKRE